MTGAARVVRTQAQLRVVAVISALLWTGAVLCAVLAVELMAGIWTRGRVVSGWSWNIALLLAVAAGCIVLWRARFVLSARRVALWMEEHVPSLQYALVTASDPHAIGDIAPLESVIENSRIDTFLRPAVLTPVIYSGVALSVMAGAFAAALTYAGAHAHGAVLDTTGGPAIGASVPNMLLNLSVRVTAPAYAGGAMQILKDPSAVTALTGSYVTIRGKGRASGVGATMAGRSVAVSGRNSWQVSFTMPSAATTISLTDRQYDRVIAVLPITDRPPGVTLVQPTRDTVWRSVPSGTVPFVAHVTDDIGLADAHLEYTITTGSGEVFKSRTESFGASRLGNVRTFDLHSALALPSLGLTQGAILSVRAVVADNNTLTGPGVSTSDTRTFRVARADEYDSLSIEAAPPPPLDRSLLTERMLIISAESLFKKQPSLPSADYIKSSGGIGADQASLRKKVYNILYEQDEAGGTGGVEGDDEELDPQLVLNRNLKEAYDAMWDAERSLNVGEIKAALPFMTRALHALDRARLANRLYLRGRAPRIVVNVEKVRLTAREKGIGSVAAGRRFRADTVRAHLDSLLGAALPLAQSDPVAFVNALTRLRAGAAAADSAFAVAIGDAVDASRAGFDMTPALVRARRALLGPPVVGNASVPWSGTWGGP